MGRLGFMMVGLYREIEIQRESSECISVVSDSSAFGGISPGKCHKVTPVNVNPAV